jgi:hypothetical protein
MALHVFFRKDKTPHLQDSVSSAELGLWSREVFVVTFRVSREPELPTVQL